MIGHVINVPHCSNLYVLPYSINNINLGSRVDTKQLGKLTGQLVLIWLPTTGKIYMHNYSENNELM